MPESLAVGREGATMPTAGERSRERRWIILSTDGRYATLGRASDPSEEEVRGAENALQSQGLAGWLAIMEGNPHVGAIPNIMEVRPLARPTTSFEAASTACIDTLVAARCGQPSSG